MRYTFAVVRRSALSLSFAPADSDSELVAAKVRAERAEAEAMVAKERAEERVGDPS